MRLAVIESGGTYQHPLSRSLLSQGDCARCSHTPLSTCRMLTCANGIERESASYKQLCCFLEIRLGEYVKRISLTPTLNLFKARAALEAWRTKPASGCAGQAWEGTARTHILPIEIPMMNKPKAPHAIQPKVDTSFRTWGGYLISFICWSACQLSVGHTSLNSVYDSMVFAAHAARHAFAAGTVIRADA